MVQNPILEMNATALVKSSRFVFPLCLRVKQLGRQDISRTPVGCRFNDNDLNPFSYIKLKGFWHLQLIYFLGQGDTAPFT